MSIYVFGQSSPQKTSEVDILPISYILDGSAAFFRQHKETPFYAMQEEGKADTTTYPLNVKLNIV